MIYSIKKDIMIFINAFKRYKKDNPKKKLDSLSLYIKGKFYLYYHSTALVGYCQS